MVLTRSQYEKMRKNSFKNLQILTLTSYYNDINTKLSNLKEKFNDFLSKYDC